MNMSMQGFVVFYVVAVALSTTQRLDAADSEVAGVFNGNNQPAKLAFVSAHKGTPIGGKETINLVFTERDHSKDAKADLKALFGDYGSAHVIAIQADGKVVTCDIRHEAFSRNRLARRHPSK